MRAAPAEIGLYPDGSGFELKQALARKHGCGAECITLGNGSNDVLVLLAEAFLTPAERSRLLAVRVSRSIRSPCRRRARQRAWRRRIAAATPMPLGHDLDADGAARQRRARGSCSSPIRTIRPAPGSMPKSLAAFHRGALPEQTLVVVDEAYIEYVERARFPGREPLARRVPEPGRDAHVLEGATGWRACASATRCRIRRLRTCSIACVSPST